jgi:peptidoglycan/xylan/chitin deacetylase (PgdA/CDA1 family)
MKCLSAILILLLTGTFCMAQLNETNKIAVTIDDLPFVGVGTYTDKEFIAMFNKLIAEIKKEKTPVIGFVNEFKLLSNGELSNERVMLLESWLNAGLDLGNHTYSHKGANVVPPAEYKEDIIKGEAVLTGLLEKRGQS